jgi:O-antigen ligase
VTSLLFGLGFGIPLTEKQVMAGVFIREPHNSYISVAARLGLLGIAAWLAMHLALLGAWLRAFRLHRDAGDRTGQNRLVLLLVFFASLWIIALAEDGFEKPFNTVPYYLAWGIVLRMAYFAGLGAAAEAPTAPMASSSTSPSWAGATPSGNREAQSS